MLIYNDEKLYNHVLNLIKKEKPSNYSTWFDYNGESYIYMSEVDPHHHREDGRQFGKFWTSTFYAIDTDFRFVYYNENDNLIVEEVELGKPYTFNAMKLHAVTHKNRVSKFRSWQYWRRKWKPENELRMIFKLSGKG